MRSNPDSNPKEKKWKQIIPKFKEFELRLVQVCNLQEAI